MPILTYNKDEDQYEGEELVLKWERDKDRQWVLRDTQGTLLDFDRYKEVLRDRHELQLQSPSQKRERQQTPELCEPYDLFDEDERGIMPGAKINVVTSGRGHSKAKISPWSNKTNQKNN